MKFQVTKIVFDFTEVFFVPGAAIPRQLQEEVVNKTLGQIWEAEDEEDLVEKISNEIGWFVEDIEYRQVPASL
jgi:hypothetical protein